MSTDPRYPIGPFQPQHELTADERRTMLQNIAATPARMREAVAGLTEVQLAAKNTAFSPRTLTAAAGQPVQLQFDNQDAGVIHNVAFTTNSSKTTVIYKSPPEAGAKIATFTFTAPSAPGSYYFYCEAHPDQMTGTFTVR